MVSFLGLQNAINPPTTFNTFYVNKTVLNGPSNIENILKKSYILTEQISKNILHRNQLFCVMCDGSNFGIVAVFLQSLESTK